MAYIGNRYQIITGSVAGTVQNYTFSLPVANVPTSSTVNLYPCFLASLAGATGATSTDTVTLILPDGTSLSLLASSTMAELTVEGVPANTVLEIAPKNISGTMVGIVLNR